MTLTRRCLLVAGSALALPATARPAPALMLARDASSGVDPEGYLVSEKFDGVRALWDGRSLRFRSGLAAPAPGWFIDRLPPEPLDGELWLARGRFEDLSGIVRRALPVDADWRRLSYQVFDQPGTPGTFRERAARLQALVARMAWAPVQAVEQRQLRGVMALRHELQTVLRAGGEGLMLHRADAHWRPGRSDDLLKLKPQDDAEATVTGHIPGRGRHAGRLGALRVQTADGITFLIGTGFSDAEREAPPAVGTIVTFTYRGFTEAGVPRFASFLRVRGL